MFDQWLQGTLRRARRAAALVSLVSGANKQTCYRARCSLLVLSAIAADLSAPRITAIGTAVGAVAFYFASKSPRMGYVLAVLWMLMLAASSALSIPLWPRTRHAGHIAFAMVFWAISCGVLTPFAVTTYLPELIGF